jgi:hypothetical protein
MAFARALLATVLCTGLGLAVAPGPPEAAHHATLTAPCCASISAIDLGLETPDFVVPGAVAAPARPHAGAIEVAIAAARAPAPTARVLDVAPKTSPPRA